MPRSKISPASALGGVASSRGSRDLSSRSAAVLSADEARRLALLAQGLLGAPNRRAGVTGVLRQLGAVQLDTISVLARSHELVAYSRLGPVGRPAVEASYWSAKRPSTAFEFWAHAACVLPMEEWPWFAFRRRHHRQRGWRGWGGVPEVPTAAVEKIQTQLRDEGPLTATDLGGAKRGGPWWDWSEVKVAVEWLLDIGDVVCVERRGWRRVYDLAERAVPAELLDLDPSDEECLARLVGLAGRSMGVATVADLADYYRLRQDQVVTVLDSSGLVPVEVRGWGSSPNGSSRRGTVRGTTTPPAWAHPELLAASARGRHRTTLLSPFDSLIWERRRTARIFGWAQGIEAYKPATQREHGYFVMPLLAGGKLLGRVDPKREGRTLVAKQLSVETPQAVEAMARALREAAEWVGCDGVAVERVTPPDLAPRLQTALAAVT
jgi:uncharacterized protein YcaQ